MPSVVYAECHYAERRCAECRYDEWRSAVALVNHQNKNKN
jgi:hypothetical protein